MPIFSRRAPAVRKQVSYEIDANLLETGQLLEALRKLFNSPNYKPPQPPAVASKIHAMSKQRNVDVQEIVRLIEQDAMLAAGVLRIAESAAYSTKIPPRTISEAVMRLGLERLTNIVWEAAMSGSVFRAKGLEGTMDSIRKHSIVTANFTQLVASYTSVPEDHAFLHGLLHDVGLTAIIIAIAGMRRQGVEIDVDENSATIEEAHEEAGATIARLWKLAPELSIAIGSHTSCLVDGHVHPLIATQVIAESIACDLGYGIRLGHSVIDAPGPAIVDRAMNSLALANLDSLRDECARRLEGIAL